MQGPLIGVLALQGAFVEHQKALEVIGCRTRQVRTGKDLDGLDAIVLPGGESTAMGLIGKNLWHELLAFCASKPTWGTCAGMILLAEKCVGASAVIQDGQALIGGVDITVCRNYFGSQISSFELATPPPPTSTTNEAFPGVFIRAPAILSAGPDVTVLGTVVATPCHQAAVTLAELERKIAAGENVIQVGVQDSLVQNHEVNVVVQPAVDRVAEAMSMPLNYGTADGTTIVLPGRRQTNDPTAARNVICSVRKDNILCTAFHPELTDDTRWHEYFVNVMVKPSR